MRNLSEKYFPVIEKFYNSGLSNRIFCERNGINHNTFAYWKTRYKRRNVAPKPGFAALQVGENGAKEITIQYTDGTRLSFHGTVESHLVKQFIPALCR